MTDALVMCGDRGDMLIIVVVAVLCGAGSVILGWWLSDVGRRK